jgi:hypothetical protein
MHADSMTFDGLDRIERCNTGYSATLNTWACKEAESDSFTVRICSRPTIDSNLSPFLPSHYIPIMDHLSKGTFLMFLLTHSIWFLFASFTLVKGLVNVPLNIFSHSPSIHGWRVIARVILHETHVLRQERLLDVLACLNWLQGASSMYRSGWCGLKSLGGSLVSWGAPFDMKVLLDERALHQQPAWMGSLSLDKERYLGGGGQKEVLSIQFCWLLHKTLVLLYARQANLTRLRHGIEVESLFLFLIRSCGGEWGSFQGLK